VGVGSGDQRCGAGRRKRKRERDMVDWWRERGQRRRMVMTDERERGKWGFFRSPILECKL